MTTSYIFAKSEFIEGIGEVHPIKLKDYDDFIDCSSHLYISKNHFSEDAHNYTLLELLIFAFKDEKMISDFERLFTLTLRSKVEFFVNENENFGFKAENGQYVDKSNYETIRSIIMRQNLMFEQKIYKDKIVQEYMNKVFQARAKTSIKMEFEDMISTVSVFTGKHYWDLAEYTIYQLKMDFSRISKFKSYDTGIAFKCVSSEPFSVEHFAENVDMFKNPYDLDNFTKSKDKTNKLDKALNK